eukprot:1863692-Lingulodinium_polyedra.AAC.1
MPCRSVLLRSPHDQPAGSDTCRAHRGAWRNRCHPRWPTSRTPRYRQRLAGAPAFVQRVTLDQCGLDTCDL